MNYFISIIAGIVLVIVISSFKKLRQIVQGEIFCLALYIIEIIQCIISKTIRIYSHNVILSIIILILIPFVILFSYYLIIEIIKSKTISKTQKIEEKEA